MLSKIVLQAIILGGAQAPANLPILPAAAHPAAARSAAARSASARSAAAPGYPWVNYRIVSLQKETPKTPKLKKKQSAYDPYISLRCLQKFDVVSRNRVRILKGLRHVQEISPRNLRNFKHVLHIRSKEVFL